VSQLDADEHEAPSRALLFPSRAWNRIPAKFRRGAAVWKVTGVKPAPLELTSPTNPPPVSMTCGAPALLTPLVLFLNRELTP